MQDPILHRLGVRRPSEASFQQGVYVMRVAAQLLDMHPQTLRKYERLGLVRPVRTGSNQRLYSEADILRLRLIKHLVDEVGVNLAGVELALNLLQNLTVLREHLLSLEAQETRQHLLQLLDACLQQLAPYSFYSQKSQEEV
ncbi:MAG: MerR family transcriptional regulator [Dehalococcoidia bacterium]|nr:MerR family transcriptional regulator [Dehalococcoidia bacterium]MDW8119144.1 MerR family transcriptional regulator [Chloroflexota bacterium]